ncbi:hypothetical protein EDC44_1017 [Cricetibacter osteomyelitidis]|uniref:Uncharacterized protein n=1 Tax=Cricetibacter osteomyelitidis TaxID=1521931 RepID=A0A4R2T7U0_9PAST|nr:hypothetical protein [Cricetibacter osteomyelitidis]TCP97626.1 hypothetical protein EDC44_1017 [Cricetibacter osteomyelitidis]
MNQFDVIGLVYCPMLSKRVYAKVKDAENNGVFLVAAARLRKIKEREVSPGEPHEVAGIWFFDNGRIGGSLMHVQDCRQFFDATEKNADLLNQLHQRSPENGFEPSGQYENLIGHYDNWRIVP